MKSSSRTNTRRLGFEQLEGRQMMAGNVTAAVKSGTLEIIGNDKANYIVVEQVSGFPDKFKVTGKALDGSSTTINGKPSVTFTGVGNDIIVRAGEGNDKIEVVGTAANRFWLPNTGDLTLYGGDGNDTITVNHVGSRDRIWIQGQAGNDTIKVDNTWASVFLNVSAGSGRDTVTMLNTTSWRDLSIDTGSSTGTPGTTGDKVILDGVRAGYHAYESGLPNGTLTLRGSDANDEFRINNSKTDFFKAYMNGGNDVLGFKNCDWDNDWFYHGGDGFDVLVGSTSTASKRPFFESF